VSNGSLTCTSTDVIAPAGGGFRLCRMGDSGTLVACSVWLSIVRQEAAKGDDVNTTGYHSSRIRRIDP
jgi:hypothetical protein